MNIVFRVDASAAIGTGHFMRCLTLADALAERGKNICFICRSLPSYFADLLSDRDYELEILSSDEEPNYENVLTHSKWLGTNQSQDVEDTLAVLSDRYPDWLVVDHYGIDWNWETPVRKKVGNILAIDDIADRRHDCSILLDQNLYPDMAVRYAGKVPNHCRLALGPKYALLRKEFSILRKKVELTDGSVERIFVFFGGVDLSNITGRVIDALVELDLPAITVDVVVGALHPNRAQIERACHQAGYTCHIQTEKIGELMLAADLAIGASGSTSWERCCLGLPTILVSLASNQVEIARSLEKAGACIYLGTAEEVVRESIVDSVRNVLQEPERLKQLSRNAFSLVDGDGADRICREMGY